MLVITTGAPSQIIAGELKLKLAAGAELTVRLCEAFVVPHEPPEVVNVKVTGEDAVADAVYVVVLGVEPVLFANVPPAPPSLHTAAVAPPPYEPPRAAVVPLWQMAGTPLPALAVGFGLTVTDSVSE